MYLNDEMYDVIDIDEAIKQKQELITKAKELSEQETGDLIKAAARLRRKWRRIPYWESAYEDQLAQEFDGYLGVVYSRRHLVTEANVEAKRALIEEVKGYDQNVPGTKLAESLERWKKVGSAGHEADEELWQEFADARHAFLEKKRVYWNERREHYDEAKAIKERVVEEAKALAEEDNFRKASARFEELLQEWKDAGYIGDRDYEKELWQEFSEARRNFNKKRGAFYSELHARQKEAYTAKTALIAEARAILEGGNYTREDTEKMKELNAKWRTLGNCGRDKEDGVWKEFRSVMDEYFDVIRGNREERQARYQERLGDLRSRKLDQIASQRRQIERLRQEAMETLSEREANEINEEIADKEEYIAELEKEIAELEEKA